MKLSKKVIIPVGFSLLLVVTRMIITQELTYVFIAWNLFLAWLPFVFSHQLETATKKWKGFMFLFLWLLFLPNAPYIITDLQHLKHRPPVPYWYDILLLFSAALNGLLLGVASLLKVERFLYDHYSRRTTGIVILCSFFLCAFGIYLGRYLRWNSWDILVDPLGLASDIKIRVLNPFDHFSTWSVTFMFGLFLYVIYFSVKNFINKSNQL